MTYISDEYRFIFIEIEKTATTSIDHNLLWSNSIKNINDEHYSERHKTASYIKSLLKDDWFNYTSFTVVRNPWQRYVSWLVWMEKILETKTKEDRVWVIFNKLFDDNNYSYKDILKTIINKTGRTQSEFVCDGTDIIVNELLRFENLQHDYNRLCSKLHIEKSGLKQLNTSKPYDYRDFYNQELIDLVYEKERRLINYAGYHYDETTQ
tara:strand:- start:50 stop:673 length:624 start_codon:yes stop_codon:yes gene_type:complete